MKAIGVLNWDSLNIPEQVNKARSVALAMTNNPNYKTPNPDLAEISKKADELESAEETLQNAGGGTVLTKKRDTKAKELKALMTRLLAYINNTANGDENVILSAGVDLKKPPIKKAKPNVVTGLKYSSTVAATILLSWNPVKDAKAYIALMSEDVTPRNFQPFLHGYSTAAKLTVANLQSKKDYFFSIVAINGAGESDPSIPIVATPL